MSSVLEVRGLKTYLYTRAGVIRAVDDVSFCVGAGETLGIVGESGCGKSMLAMSLVRLVPQPAARIIAGQVLLDGEDLLTKSDAQMRAVRGRRMSMILQDPHQSLNPVFSIGSQLGEVFSGAHGASLRTRVVEALRQVRVPGPEGRLASYPHEISGGMKQRVVGAMAIANRPRVLIADEPTTALDVTVQAQYLRLLRQLQRETDVAIVLITHDFGVVAEMCDRVAVMYAGRIVEQGPVREIFDRPSHPYTRALLGSLPRMEKRGETLVSIEGQPPPLYDLPTGCRFAPRCPQVMERCVTELPDRFVVDGDHAADCWLLESAPSKSDTPVEVTH